MDQAEVRTPAKHRDSEMIKGKDPQTGNDTLEDMHGDDKMVNKFVDSSVKVDLTDDAWLCVFSYLRTIDRASGRVAKVCQRWNKLIQISWKSITTLTPLHQCHQPKWISFFNSSINQKIKLHILEVSLQRCGVQLKCVEIDKPYIPLNSVLLDLLAHHSGSLQELKLGWSYLTNPQLKILAERLPRLQSLHLDVCDNISEDGMRGAFTVGLQRLKTLNVAKTQLTGEFFSLVPQSLTEVLVHNCNLTDRGIRLMAEKCPNLEITDIGECNNRHSAQSIKHLFMSCPKLRRLTCPYLLLMNWDTSALQTLYKLPLLEVHLLDKLRDSLVTDKFVGELSKHCPRMTAITFMNGYALTDDACHHISSWAHLEGIKLHRCHQITDKGFTLLSSNELKLKKVHLQQCPQITDAGVIGVVLAHPSLTMLDIAGQPVTCKVLPALEASVQCRQRTQVFKIQLPFDLHISPGADKMRRNPRCRIFNF